MFLFFLLILHFCFQFWLNKWLLHCYRHLVSATHKHTIKQRHEFTVTLSYSLDFKRSLANFQKFISQKKKDALSQKKRTINQSSEVIFSSSTSKALRACLSSSCIANSSLQRLSFGKSCINPHHKNIVI